MSADRAALEEVPEYRGSVIPSVRYRFFTNGSEPTVLNAIAATNHSSVPSRTRSSMISPTNPSTMHARARNVQTIGSPPLATRTTHLPVVPTRSRRFDFLARPGGSARRDGGARRWLSSHVPGLNRSGGQDRVQRSRHRRMQRRLSPRIQPRRSFLSPDVVKGWKGRGLSLTPALSTTRSFPRVPRVPPSRLREKNPAEIPGKRRNAAPTATRRSQENDA